MAEPEPTDQHEFLPGALPVRPRALPPPTRHVGAFLVLVAAASFWIGWAYFGTFLFASWLVIVFWPLREKLVRKVRRAWLASLLLATGLVFALVGPVIVGGIFIGFMIADFVAAAIEAVQTGSVEDALRSAFGQEATLPDTTDLRGMAQTLFRSLPALVGGIGTAVGIVADLGVRVFLFIIALYYLFLDGNILRSWIAHTSPLLPHQTRQLMKAYADIGRGMLVGVLLIVILQGAIAMLGYLVVGVPRAIELGFLTALAGFVPAIGTALVWVPLGVILMFAGHLGQGIGVLVVGFVVSIVDNVARPWLAKLGQVPMPTLSLFWSIFGGIATLGPVGVIIGPAIFGMAQAAMVLYIENKEIERRAIRKAQASKGDE